MLSAGDQRIALANVECDLHNEKGQNRPTGPQHAELIERVLPHFPAGEVRGGLERIAAALRQPLPETDPDHQQRLDAGRRTAALAEVRRLKGRLGGGQTGESAVGR